MKTLQLAVLTLVMSFASQAAAQYVFSCYPPTEHDIGPTAPNALLMLDMSGSMAFLSGEDVDSDGNEDTRYKVARLAITEVATSTGDPGPCPGNCDSVRMGLAYFPSSGDLGAASATVVGEDTATPIDTWLSPTRTPIGGTPTGDAMTYIADTSELRDPTRPNIAILVTDGDPSAVDQSDALAQGQTALNKACEARNRTAVPSVTTYVLGFGSGSNEQVNSAIAAAGGTGMCCGGGESAPCDVADQIDPCVVGANAIFPAASAGPGGYYVTGLGSGYSCSGSLEATGSDIKDQLLAVLAETSCIFALDIPPDYPEPGADPNPDATEVKIWHSVFGASIPIPPANDDDTLPDYLEDVLGVSETLAETYEDEGWEFTGPSRQFVRLTPKLCADIQLNNITKVTTEVACACVGAGDSCTLLVGGFTPTESGRMRCGAGTNVCMGSTTVCVPTTGAMPEVCNGIDDDCDGSVDNMSTSWDKPEFSALPPLPASRIGIDCSRRDVCGCPSGPDVIRGTDYMTYIDQWQPVCQCGEGLEGE